MSIHWTPEVESIAGELEGYLRARNPIPLHFVAAVNENVPNHIAPFTEEELEDFWQQDLSPVEAMTIAYATRIYS